MTYDEVEEKYFKGERDAWRSNTKDLLDKVIRAGESDGDVAANKALMFAFTMTLNNFTVVARTLITASVDQTGAFEDITKIVLEKLGAAKVDMVHVEKGQAH